MILGDTLLPELKEPAVPDTPEETPPSAPTLWTSVVRTVVPYLTALVVTKAAEYGFDIDAEDATGGIVVVLGSVWYAIVRKVEETHPGAGRLLGIPKTPVYEVK